MSDGKGKVTAGERGCAVSPGWVLEHPSRATRWVRAARSFILPKVADVPIYLRWGGGGKGGEDEMDEEE